MFFFFIATVPRLEGMARNLRKHRTVEGLVDPLKSPNKNPTIIRGSKLILRSQTYGRNPMYTTEHPLIHVILKIV
jgi:hypothetical protein